MGANFTPDFQGYTNMKPFRFWCQKVLPTVYEDSLSYYEVLCKLIKYLNTVMENMEKVEQNTDALLEAYQRLQDWVNMYFDNLDVQDEIDHKIDEMVEDGTFDRWIEPIIQNYEGDLQTIYNQFVVQAEQALDDYKDDAQDYVKEAEAWAKGTKGGVPVVSTDEQYHDNSKYWAEQAQQSAGSASSVISTVNTLVAQAEGAVDDAENWSKESEAWAKGTKDGVPVTSTDEQYEDNAKYWAEQAEQAAQGVAADLKQCCYMIRGGTCTTYTSSAGVGSIKIDSDAWRIFNTAAAAANWSAFVPFLVGPAANLYDVYKSQITNLSQDGQYYIPIFVLKDKAGNPVPDNTVVEFVGVYIWPFDATTVFTGTSVTS